MATLTLLDYGRVARDTGVDEIPAVRLRSISFLDKLLDKIRNNQSTSAIQMNAVCVKTPAVESGDFVGALAQHQSADSITIERKKTKSCECAPLRRFHNLRDDRFIDGDIVGSLLSGHGSDNVAELLNSPVELTLEGVRGYWVFSDRRQRTKRNGGRGLGLQAKYDCPKVFTEPLG